MSTQKAIRIRAAGKAELVSDSPIPKLRDDYIIVKTEAVALNPTDWKHIDFMAGPGTLVGCDYSGVVQRVGAAVKNGLKVGDRVAGMVHGGNDSNHDDGSFAEYITAKADMQMKIPDDMSFADAATLGAGVITAGQALYQSLGLPLPDNASSESPYILVYGGSTATGNLAIQFAKLSGYKVFTTCSPKNEALVREAGADKVYDYRSPDWASRVRKETDDKLRLVFDTVSDESTAKSCCEAMGSQGGKYTALNPVERLPRDDVENLMTMAFTAPGEAFEMMGNEIPAKPDDFAFAVKFTRLAQDLLARGKLRLHPADVREEGLEGILDGLQEVREGKVSGTKLVYLMG